jgi:ABC-type transporter Mla subunit MlaD
MAQERHYTVVGFFVMIALCIVLFGSGYLYHLNLQSKSQTYVMFFNGALTGLGATSTVAYRGVKIGEVKLIEVTENAARTRVEIPVYVSFFVEESFSIKERPIDLLIKEGVVASISQPNLLSGVAQIDLIESNIPRSGKQKYYRKLPIFPTKPTETLTTIDETLKMIQKTGNDISKFIQSKEVHDTIVSAQAMADNLQQMATKINDNTSPVVASLFQTMTQISKTAYSVQNLSDYVARHPESLLRGKP